MKSTARSNKDIEDCDDLSLSSSAGEKGHEESTGTRTERSDSSTSESFGLGVSRVVTRSKLCVYISLLIAGVLVSIGAFIFVRNTEVDTFEDEFKVMANELIDVAEENAENTVAQVRSLAITMASFATNKNEMEWPNVTLPNFELRLEDTMKLTGAELITFLPIVQLADRESFEAYAAIESHRQFQPELGQMPEEFHNVKGTAVTETELGFHTPLWQIAPIVRDASILLLDMNTFGWFKQLELDVLETSHAIMSGVVHLEYLLQATRTQDQLEYHPRTAILQHVAKSVSLSGEFSSEIGGFILAVMPWEQYLMNVLNEGMNGFLVEINDHCGTVFTYEVDGHHAILRGEGGLHDSKYNSLHQEASFAGFAQYDGEDTDTTHCYYTIDVYPTDELKDAYLTSEPYLFAMSILLVFIFITGVFFCYDFFVTRRQRQITNVAKRATNIVKSLFPKNVQRRIMEEVRMAEVDSNNSIGSSLRVSMKARLKDALNTSNHSAANDDKFRNAPPIADLFPAVTVMFADLVGFTAWSSMREPPQVFHLLETIYAEFDHLAKKRRIFKVETVGDCYVAASGLPDPRRDHAVAMARFARDCRARMMELMTRLEETLGPDTGELGLRIGLHSGPVTGGVLRGEKARFQLFGDTMNTTARIESAGEKNKVHVSEEFATSLQQFGKGNWLVEREDKVYAKGKGELKTFWLIEAEKALSVTSGDSSELCNDEREFAEDDVNMNKISPKVKAVSVAADDKLQRLVKWNTEVMFKILQEVAQRRGALGVTPDFAAVRVMESSTRKNSIPIQELVEIISLPQFDEAAAKRQIMLPKAAVPKVVKEQLHAYIHAIASMYWSNPFHSFEHASHVLMSVTKLFSRIVAPELADLDNEKNIHDYSYGITSDPITQFAAAFSALIHDVDHQGVTNATLIAENAMIANVYDNKSVAEQNSVDIAWDLLMDEAFVDLRNCIYSTPNEYHRFRAMVVNLVLATDIMDKDLGKARKERWGKAFAISEESVISEDATESDAINRKATIVLEHVIQASDVAHTMQHWHIYRKWNTRLFHELMKAYKEGRTSTNPADNWYKGEMSFFDFYIIPLAKKLKDCGVFGVSSDEYLNYAIKNRKEWEVKGQEVIAEMVRNLNNVEV